MIFRELHKDPSFWLSWVVSVYFLFLFILEANGAWIQYALREGFNIGDLGIIFDEGFVQRRILGVIFFQSPRSSVLDPKTGTISCQVVPAVAFALEGGRLDLSRAGRFFSLDRLGGQWKRRVPYSHVRHFFRSGDTPAYFRFPSLGYSAYHHLSKTNSSPPPQPSVLTTGEPL